MKKPIPSAPTSRAICGVLLIVAISLAINWEALREGRVAALWKNLATPRSGEEEVLPESVRGVLAVARELHLQSMSLSPAVAQNRFFAQPLTEGVYPIVITDSAGVMVSFTSEPVPDGFVTLKVAKGLRIAQRR